MLFNYESLSQRHRREKERVAFELFEGRERVNARFLESKLLSTCHEVCFEDDFVVVFCNEVLLRRRYNDLLSNVPIVSTYSLVIQDLDRERRLRTGEYDGEPRLPPRLGERLLLRRLLLLLPPLRPPRSRSRSPRSRSPRSPRSTSRSLLSSRAAAAAMSSSTRMCEVSP